MSRRSQEDLFIRSQYTTRAVEALSSVEPGDTIGYKRLSSHIGINILKDGRCYIQSARRILQKEQAKVFGAVPGIGLRLLFPHEVVSRGTHRRKKIRNQTRYCLGEYDTVAEKVIDLKQESQVEFYANTALMESLRQQASYTADQKRRQEMLAAVEPPQPPQTLEPFKGS